jgi:hypothetical protein
MDLEGVVRLRWEDEHEHMKNRTPGRPIAVHDYQQAVQDAVSWLGERYLLAEASPKRREEPKPFFAQTREWHPVVRPRSISRH